MDVGCDFNLLDAARMKIVAAVFTVQIEDDDDLDIEAALDALLSSIGYAGPVNCSITAADPDDDDRHVLVSFDPADE
jgi:hypothetical protein